MILNKRMKMEIIEIYISKRIKNKIFDYFEYKIINLKHLKMNNFIHSLINYFYSYFVPYFIMISI